MSSCCRAATPPARPMPPPRRNCSNSTPQGKFIREIGKNLYAWSFGHTVKIDPAGQHLGDRQGLGHGDQVRSRGPRRDGVRPQAGGLRRRHRTAQASQAAAAGRGRPVSPGHRRHLGQGRQHLHQRRLHQFARRQGRQGRQLAEVVGRPRQGARPVQHPAFDRGRRQRQRLCRRPRQSPHPGVRRRRQIPAPVHHRRAGAGRTPSRRSARSRTKR